MPGDFCGHGCSEVTWQNPALSKVSLHTFIGLFRKLGLPAQIRGLTL